MLLQKNNVLELVWVLIPDLVAARVHDPDKCDFFVARRVANEYELDDVSTRRGRIA
jgi:hypothetical protein